MCLKLKFTKTAMALTLIAFLFSTSNSFAKSWKNSFWYSPDLNTKSDSLHYLSSFVEGNDKLYFTAFPYEKANPNLFSNDSLKIFIHDNISGNIVGIPLNTQYARNTNYGMQGNRYFIDVDNNGKIYGFFRPYYYNYPLNSNSHYINNFIYDPISKKWDSLVVKIKRNGLMDTSLDRIRSFTKFTSNQNNVLFTSFHTKLYSFPYEIHQSEIFYQDSGYFKKITTFSDTLDSWNLHSDDGGDFVKDKMNNLYFKSYQSIYKFSGINFIKLPIIPFFGPFFGSVDSLYSIAAVRFDNKNNLIIIVNDNYIAKYDSISNKWDKIINYNDFYKKFGFRLALYRKYSKAREAQGEIKNFGYDNNGNFYFLKDKTIYKYNLQSKTSTNFTINISTFRNNKSKSISIEINDFSIDKNNNIYFSTNSGLLKLSLDHMNIIRGKVFLDMDKNGLLSSKDEPLSNIWVGSKKNLNYSSAGITDQFGEYEIKAADTTSETVSVLPNFLTPYIDTIYNNNNVINIDTSKLDSIYVNKDILISLDKNKNNISTNIDWSRFRYGFNFYLRYHINTINIDSFNFELQIDTNLSIDSTIPKYVSKEGNKFYFEKRSLGLFDHSSIVFYGKVKNMVQYVSFLATITNDSNGIVKTLLKDTFNVNVTNSYDPNDKSVFPSDKNGKIRTSNKSLTYTIRFQNTGNDTAFNIFISDTIHKSLDLSSMRILESSHKYKVQIGKDNAVKFVFNKIMLPDSIVNEKLSHGYITYTLNIKKGENFVGNKVYNTAHIYFDYNPAIVTNTTISEFSNNVLYTNILSAEQVPILTQFGYVYPNPSHGFFSLLQNDEMRGYYIISDLTGRLIQKGNINSKKMDFNLSQENNGIYLIKIFGNDNILNHQQLLIKN